MEYLDTHTLISIFYAFIGGILPTLIWLYFWNSEKRKNPEPKGTILLAFIGGVIAVFISLYLEKITYSLDPNIIFTGILHPILQLAQNLSNLQNISLNKILLAIIFAPIIEELAKFIIAYVLALRSRDDDEPIDPMIYMITTALGFAAVENALFLIDPIMRNNFILSIITGNMRFIGATLLHTISSATIGIFFGYSMFDKKLRELFYIIIGIICAIILHAYFNLLMIGTNQDSFIALELIWVAVIILLFIFEMIKKRKIEKIS